MIHIENLETPFIKKAGKLVAKVFPFRSLSERLTFFAFKHQHHWIVQWIMSLFGVASLSHFWVAIDDDNNVVGITGIYTYEKDKDEAIWMAWFCVDPGHRGKGIGKRLIEYSISKARESGKKYFRLYTSSDPNEAAAQNLYEKYGFNIVKKKKKMFYTKLYGELVL
ncbi:MAG: GNAT family N-acetyltransferase [Spirochaetales bacterium]|nr:GNAT family N-acetyltransferase [Spirochaetales bacterium]